MYSWSCPDPNGPSPADEYAHPIHAYSLLNATGECGSAFVSQCAWWRLCLLAHQRGAP